MNLLEILCFKTELPVDLCDLTSVNWNGVKDCPAELTAVYSTRHSCGNIFYMLLHVYNVILEDYTGQILVGTVTSVREIRPKGNKCSVTIDYV